MDPIDDLDMLLFKSNFTKTQLRLWYQFLKQVFPDRLLTREQFHVIFSQVFPKAVTFAYADYMFNSFDGTLNKDMIQISKVISSVSMLGSADIRDKLKWVFRLYDIHKNNKISFSELWMVIRAVYELNGFDLSDEKNKLLTFAHAKHVFQLFLSIFTAAAVPLPPHPAVGVMQVLILDFRSFLQVPNNLRGCC
ncbi:unnamed protein product [Soboliphyme baturini]|uniref:EF-hand domain-containing protein n=1 Tax=Soboliphyme baturini TaxID=241478 RepID=A0A183J4I5_9BILA|nr:unnamed protein product [Soboliphyme baturini]